MNFLVIGHLCCDEIHRKETESIKGFGGIYYSLCTLATIAGNEHTIIPVFGVGKDRKAVLQNELAIYPNINTDGIYELDAPTNKVVLSLQDNKLRAERSENIAPPISSEAIIPFLKSADAVLINMISGFDIEFDTLYEINIGRSSRSVPVYFDFHSMSLGIDDDFRRFRKPFLEWRRWAFNADIIQMNEIEAATITAEKLAGEQLAKAVLSVGPKGLIVTHAERGAELFYEEKKKIFAKKIPGIKIEVPSVPQSTGCGDVFGGAFIYQFVTTGDMAQSAVYANRVAAAKLLLDNSVDLHKIAQLAENIAV